MPITFHTNTRFTPQYIFSKTVNPETKEIILICNDFYDIGNFQAAHMDDVEDDLKQFRGLIEIKRQEFEGINYFIILLKFDTSEFVKEGAKSINISELSEPITDVEILVKVNAILHVKLHKLVGGEGAEQKIKRQKTGTIFSITRSLSQLLLPTRREAEPAATTTSSSMVPSNNSSS